MNLWLKQNRSNICVLKWQRCDIVCEATGPGEGDMPHYWISIGKAEPSEEGG